MVSAEKKFKKKFKNLKILLFQAFWTDGQIPCTRTRNLLYSSSQNIKLVLYLQEHGIDAHYNVYDFSEKRVLNEAVHIPYPTGVYKRSEKLNKIVQLHKDFDFMFCFDSDAYFHESNFPDVLEKIKSLEKNDIHLFEMASLDDKTSQQVINGDDIDPFDNYRFSTFTIQDKSGTPLKGAFGGLGGVFLCCTDLLLREPFNESFITHGDEDIEALTRIKDNTEAKLIRNHDMFPFHLYHFRDMYNENYITPMMRDERWEADE